MKPKSVLCNPSGMQCYKVMFGAAPPSLHAPLAIGRTEFAVKMGWWVPEGVESGPGTVP